MKKLLLLTCMFGFIAQPTTHAMDSFPGNRTPVERRDDRKVLADITDDGIVKIDVSEISDQDLSTDNLAIEIDPKLFRNAKVFEINAGNGHTFIISKEELLEHFQTKIKIDELQPLQKKSSFRDRLASLFRMRIGKYDIGPREFTRLFVVALITVVAVVVILASLGGGSFEGGRRFGKSQASSNYEQQSARRSNEVFGASLIQNGVTFDNLNDPDQEDVVKQTIKNSVVLSQVGDEDGTINLDTSQIQVSISRHEGGATRRESVHECPVSNPSVVGTTISVSIKAPGEDTRCLLSGRNADGTEAFIIPREGKPGGVNPFCFVTIKNGQIVKIVRCDVEHPGHA